MTDTETVSPITRMLVDKALVAIKAREELLATTAPVSLWVPNRRFKGIVIGAPKVGKTGAIIALLNAGYRVIVAAFDPGQEVILNNADPDKLSNLYILPFEDRRGFQGTGSKMTAGRVGEATAFAKFVAFLDDGRARLSKAQGGEIVELGPSETWGYDTFLVVDNLSPLGKAAFERHLSQQGKTRQSRNRRDWGFAQDELDDVLIQLASSFFNYHLVLLAHWDVQGPKEWEDEDKNNRAKTDYNNELREREQDLIPTKQVPKSIGRVLSRNLIGHFPTCVWTEVNDDGQRIFDLEPKSFRDSGVPVRPGTLPKTLPIETGLLTIFRAVTGAPLEAQCDAT